MLEYLFPQYRTKKKTKIHVYDFLRMSFEFCLRSPSSLHLPFFVYCAKEEKRRTAILLNNETMKWAMVIGHFYSWSKMS